MSQPENEKFEKIDYFTDPSLVEDPYPYYEYLRSQGPVVKLPNLHGVVAVSGYDEAAEVYRDPDTFSSCNSVIGPFAAFPVRLEGDDISENDRPAIATSSRCTSTWSRWTRPSTPDTGRC